MKKLLIVTASVLMSMVPVMQAQESDEAPNPDAPGTGMEKSKVKSCSKLKFRGSLSSFHAVREERKIVVCNQYVRCVHDLNHGGELTEAVILNGSGENLFVKPQTTIIGIMENGGYHCYSSSAAPVQKYSVSEKHGAPVLKFSCFPTDSQGKKLDGLVLHHRVEYTRQGEALHRIILSASQKIKDLGMIQIGTLYPVKRMDTLAVLPSLMEMSTPYGSSCRWHRLAGSDTEEFSTRWLPKSMLVFQRGVDGFQYVRGDCLAAWDKIGGKLPGFEMGLFHYTPDLDAYEMRFSALDCRRNGQYLEGEHVFEFSLAFPFVKEKTVPLVPCTGSVLNLSRPDGDRWIRDEELSSVRSGGGSLLLMQNDGNTHNDRIFWRNGDYPPYPPEEMSKMDEMLDRAHKQHLDVVPYFSLHEFHPESAGFRKNAKKWSRIIAEEDGLIPSYGPNGYYGYQMCLHSGWSRKRTATINQVLARHKFNGVYYDWCLALECINGEHGPRHWDFRKLMELLLWSHDRVGENGVLFLHQTSNPNIAAENLAGLILTEETVKNRISSEMFSPHAHFLNICPRQVCLMMPAKSTAADLRRYAMCALLHHATVFSRSREIIAFYREQTGLIGKCSGFKRHTAPGEGRCGTSNPQAVGMSVYWNDTKAMLVFANLMESQETVEYWFSPDESVRITGKITIPPLKIQTTIQKIK